MKELKTPHGTVTFPTFMPVTTFGDKYPLDKLVRPYLCRMSDCLMVSYHYAQEMKKRPDMPLFIDSGGFAGLFDGAVFIDHKDHACIQTNEGEILDPLDVLAFQMRNADIGATLDFIIPPGLPEEECRHRQDLTVKNALYAKEHLAGSELILFASLQCWDEASARRSARLYSEAGFHGIAIGGMVPRAKDGDYIRTIVRAVREEAPCCLLHIFGIGNPGLIPGLVEAGADSFDSSSYVRQAVDASSGENGGPFHMGIHEAVRRLYRISDSLKGVSGQFEEAVPNSWLV